MFGWLTRRDGNRGAKAARRLASPRGAVFSEFALTMPIVMLVCSALIEITGYWDAQVMANHAAWTVGRIAMVRGSDGLPFSDAMHKKSKTGITSTNMPASIQTLIDDLNAGLKAADKFNNRGNVATMFLMSTCGIGYFGGTPGKDLSDAFNKMLEDGVKAITDGIPEWIADALTNIVLPDINIPGGAGSFIENLVNEILNKVLKEILGELVLKPLAEWLKDLLSEAFKSLFGEGGIKIDDFFGGDSGGARFARQIYGAASRIVRAENKTGKEVLTVEDMDGEDDGFLFAKKTRSLGRLVYPQVADQEVKSDGYFVTGAHGWPPNDQGLAMVHVEVDWPYEYAWLFPVVSGGTSTNTPVATGHSMVFPQPDIQNEHLYSEGATAFEPGSYTNKLPKAFDDLQKEMMQYLKFVKFGMKYRICEETLSFEDGKYHTASATWWKYCPQLKDLWPFDSGSGDSYPVGGDYGRCWSALTGDKGQDATARSLKGDFVNSSYHAKDYFYWNDKNPGWGDAHKRYGPSLVSRLGDAGLNRWYNSKNGLAYNNSSASKYSYSQKDFKKVFDKCVKASKGDEKKFLQKAGYKKLYESIQAFAKANRVNVYNIVDWQEGVSAKNWAALDAKVHSTAQEAERSFMGIRKLLKDEINDIEEIESGSAQWTGSSDDPVLDQDSTAVMKDPEKAAAKAQEKWKKLKDKLRDQLKEVDDAADTLRGQWGKYQTAVGQFTAARDACVKAYFAEAFIKTLAKRRSTTPPSPFRIPAGAMPYDINRGTDAMLGIAESYKKAAETAYKKEAEYGAMLGLKSGEQAKQEGKNPWEVVDEGGNVNPDKPGSLAAGSDEGDLIGYKDRPHDRQTYHEKEGAWQWDD